MIHRTALIALGLLVTTGAAASADTIAYWQFDDGIAPASAGTLVTEYNAPTLNGTAGTISSGALPQFSSDTPGNVIVGDPVINTTNTSSLMFNNSGAPFTGNDGHGPGGRITVTDPGGAGSLLKPSSFTIEGFVKVDQSVGFPTLVGKSRADAGGASWIVDLNNNATQSLRVRIDSQALGETTNVGGTFNQGFTSNANGFVGDGEWHHWAVTYDGTTRAVKLYVDYLLVGSGTTTSNLVYDDSPLYIGASAGGRPFDGWLDEIRLSDTVLAPSEFLTIPAPAALPAGLVLLAVGATRRRR